MAPKRKRAAEPETPKKKPHTNKRGRRVKSTTTSSGASTTASTSLQTRNEVAAPEVEYKVRNILEESATRYRIDWEDGPNGEKYDPTWEPKEYANEAAILDWEEQKRREALLKGSDSEESVLAKAPITSRSSVTKKAAATKPSSTAGIHRSEPPKKKRGLHRKKPAVASPEPEEVADEENHAESRTRQDQEDDSVSTPPTQRPGRHRKRPVVQNSPPPSPVKQRKIGKLDHEQEQTQAQNTVEEAIAGTEASTEELPETIDTTQEDVYRLQNKSRLEVPAGLDQEDEIEDSSFPSSQVIAGTQPQHAEPPSQLQSVDAAAAFNLTQKHSQYQPEDTSRSEDTTGSALVTSSSSIHTFATPRQFPSSAVIPDSQSLNYSTSYVPSQNKSGDSSKQSDLTGSQLEVATVSQPQPVETHAVPESSIAQRPQTSGIDTLHDNSRAQPTDTDQLDGAILPEAPSPVEPAAQVIEFVNYPASPASHVAARSASSASSPPPTESPDKSQSVSQRLQDQSGETGYSKSIEQAAQVVGTVESNRLFTDQSIVPPQFSDKWSGPRKSPSDRIDFEQEYSELRAQVLSQEPGTEASLGHQTLIPAPSLQSADKSTQPGLNISDLHTNTQSPPLSSSPFPSVPSRALGITGVSAPPLLPFVWPDSSKTPEAGRLPTMSASPKSSSSRGARFLERMSAAKAANRARMSNSATVATPKPASAVPARLQSPSLVDREARSPSMVPAVEVIAKEAPEDYYRSERYETLLPGDDLQMHLSNGDPSIDSLHTSYKALGVTAHNYHDFPITFGEHQRSTYKETITWNKDAIEEFTSKVWPVESQPADKARDILHQLRNIVLHPDLNDSSNTQPSQDIPTLKAQWDVDTSAKFRFLRSLFAASQPYDMTVLLLAPDERVMEILHAFLRGIDVSFQTGTDRLAMHKPAAVTLLTTAQLEGVPQSDLIVSLGGSKSSDDISKVHSHFPNVPAIALLIPQSVEHIEKYVSDQLSEAERLHVLLSTVTHLRNDAGREGDINAMDAAASSLVNYILNHGDWPFAELPEIRLVDPMTPSQASTYGDTSEGSLNGHGLKRRADADSDMQNSTKKQKAEIIPSAANTTQNADVSHVSESEASQHAAAIKALKQEFAKKEKEMKAALYRSQNRLREHVEALTTLQYDHEEQRQKLLAAELDRDKALETAQAAVRRITNLGNKVQDLQTECTSLQEQLRGAKEALLNHDVPERIELETLKATAAAAESEKTKLLNKVRAAEDQCDYVREQYQTASQQAASFGTTTSALTAKVAELETKASGEQSKLRVQTLDTHHKDLSARNRQLELMLKSREELLNRKEEEITRLKESGRGRMNTRQSSVPRTPRIGSPLAAAPGSRAGSPAAGRAPHPLRKAD